jgi:hypothetical protein
MSVYDLYQSYLNQISDVNQNQTPGITDPNYLLYLQQQQGQGGGGENDNNNDFTDGRATNNLGINSFADAFSAIQGQMTPGGVIGGILGGIPGALIGRGIGSLVDRFRGDPFGGLSAKGLSPDVQAAIEKDIQREAKDYGGNGGKGPSGGGRSDPYGGGRGGLHDGE